MLKSIFGGRAGPQRGIMTSTQEALAQSAKNSAVAKKKFDEAGGHDSTYG